MFTDTNQMTPMEVYDLKQLMVEAHGVIFFGGDTNNSRRCSLSQFANFDIGLRVIAQI